MRKIGKRENIDKLKDKSEKKVYINLRRGRSFCVGVGFCYLLSNYLKCNDFWFYFSNCFVYGFLKIYIYI